MILTDAALGDASLPDTSGVEGISTDLRPLWTMGWDKGGVEGSSPARVVTTPDWLHWHARRRGESMLTGGSRGGKLRPAAGRTVDGLRWPTECGQAGAKARRG